MTDDPNRRPPTGAPGAADGPAPVRNPTEARQGATPGKARWVLFIGLPVVIVVLFLAYLGTVP